MSNHQSSIINLNKQYLSSSSVSTSSPASSNFQRMHVGQWTHTTDVLENNSVYIFSEVLKSISCSNPKSYTQLVLTYTFKITVVFFSETQLP